MPFLLAGTKDTAIWNSPRWPSDLYSLFAQGLYTEKQITGLTY